MAAPQRPYIAGPRIDRKIAEAALCRRIINAIIFKKRRIDVTLIIEGVKMLLFVENGFSR